MFHPSIPAPGGGPGMYAQPWGAPPSKAQGSAGAYNQIATGFPTGQPQQPPPRPSPSARPAGFNGKPTAKPSQKPRKAPAVQKHQRHLQSRRSRERHRCHFSLLVLLHKLIHVANHPCSKETAQSVATLLRRRWKRRFACPTQEDSERAREQRAREQPPPEISKAVL